MIQTVLDLIESEPLTVSPAKDRTSTCAEVPIELLTEKRGRSWGASEAHE